MAEQGHLQLFQHEFDNPDYLEYEPLHVPVNPEDRRTPSVDGFVIEGQNNGPASLPSGPLSRLWAYSEPTAVSRQLERRVIASATCLW